MSTAIAVWKVLGNTQNPPDYLNGYNENIIPRIMEINSPNDDNKNDELPEITGCNSFGL